MALINFIWPRNKFMSTYHYDKVCIKSWKVFFFFFFFFSDLSHARPKKFALKAILLKQRKTNCTYQFYYISSSQDAPCTEDCLSGGNILTFLYIKTKKILLLTRVWLMALESYWGNGVYTANAMQFANIVHNMRYSKGVRERTNNS